MAAEDTAVLLLCAAGVLLLLLLLIVGCVAGYRRWRDGYWSCGWPRERDGVDDDEDDDDGGDVEQIALIPGIAARNSSIMDDDGNARSKRLLATMLLPFWRRRSSTIDSRTHLKAAVSKKIHQPYFYPLLDETVQWWHGWEDQHNGIAASVSVIVPPTTSDASTSSSAKPLLSPRPNANADNAGAVVLPNVPVEELLDISLS